MAITRITEFQSAPGKTEKLRAFMVELLDYIRESEGCEGVQLLQQQENPSCFTVIEQWQGTEYHQRSVENYPVDKMHAAMPLFGAAPKGAFFAEV